MAARYVNPSNVVAQGQDFYTGLPAQDQQQAGSGPGLTSRTQQMAGTGPGLSSGSYAGHGGGGGGNVMGRGSGGSAGVGADRTGSDSSKSWNYKPQLNIQIARDEEKGRGGPEGEVDPPKPEEGGINGPPINPAKGRPKQPPGGALEPYKGPFIPGTTTPKRIRPDWDTHGGLLGGDGGTPNFDAATAPKPLQLGRGSRALGRGSKPMGELEPGKPTGELNPAPWKMPGPIEFPGGNSWDKWAKASDAAKSGAVGRKRPDRKMLASDAMWMAREITAAPGPGAYERSLASPAGSRANGRPA